jgi:hypothetical protein
MGKKKIFVKLFFEETNSKPKIIKELGIDESTYNNWEKELCDNTKLFVDKCVEKMEKKHFTNLMDLIINILVLLIGSAIFFYILNYYLIQNPNACLIFSSVFLMLFCFFKIAKYEINYRKEKQEILEEIENFKYLNNKK